MELYELCKALFLDWLLFGIIEAYIFCLFLENICNCEKIGIKNIIMFSIFSTFITTCVFPPLYQLFGCSYLYMLLGYYSKNSKLQNIKFATFAVLGISIIEIPYAVIIETLFNVEAIINNEVVSSIFIFLPIKAFELFLILKHSKGRSD